MDVFVNLKSVYYGKRRTLSLKDSVTEIKSSLGKINLDGSDLSSASLLATVKTNINSTYDVLDDLEMKLSKTINLLTQNNPELFNKLTSFSDEDLANEFDVEIIEANGEEIYIPKVFAKEIRIDLNKEEDSALSLNDLQNVEEMYISSDSDYSTQDIHFFTYCENLKEVRFSYNGAYMNENLNSIIPLIPNIQTVTINGATSNQKFFDITPESLAFIDKTDSLETLNIEKCNIMLGCEEQMNKLKNLTIMATSSLNATYNNHYDIDFSKLVNLEKLKISRLTLPYDLAMYFTTDDYNTLINNGVNVYFTYDAAGEDVWNDSYIDAWKRTCERLDAMIAEMDINENSTEQEKIDAIIVEVLKKMHYDDETAEALANNLPTDDRKFYDGGALNPIGFPEEDQDVYVGICGNYAALTEALFKRVCGPGKAYYISSQEGNHAWNIVKIEGKYYYLDNTWIDSYTQYVEYTLTEEERQEWLEIEEELGSEFKTNSDNATVMKAVSIDAMQYIQENEINILDYIHDSDWYISDTNNSTFTSDKHHQLNDKDFHSEFLKSIIDGQVNNEKLIDLLEKAKKLDDMAGKKVKCNISEHGGTTTESIDSNLGAILHIYATIHKIENPKEDLDLLDILGLMYAYNNGDIYVENGEFKGLDKLKNPQEGLTFWNYLEAILPYIKKDSDLETGEITDLDK